VGRVLCRVVDPLFHPLAILIDFFFSGILFPQKNDMTKRLDPFDV
jgi:hypothetical protein